MKKNHTMRNLKSIILISLLALYSCKKNVVNFTEPQPSEKKNLSKLPNRFLGIYVNTESGCKLSIESDIITKTFSSLDTVSFKEYNSAAKENTKLLFQLSDSIFIVELSIIDTILDLKKGDVLRKLNQNYFLNTKNTNENWNVSKLNFKRNYLTLSEIFNESEIELLNEITNQTTIDSIYPKTYSINKKQFKEFVNKNGFSESEIYIKE